MGKIFGVSITTLVVVVVVAIIVRKFGDKIPLLNSVAA